MKYAVSESLSHEMLCNMDDITFDWIKKQLLIKFISQILPQIKTHATFSKLEFKFWDDPVLFVKVIEYSIDITHEDWNCTDYLKVAVVLMEKMISTNSKAYNFSEQEKIVEEMQLLVTNIKYKLIKENH